MDSIETTRELLLEENDRLRHELAEAQELIRAIHAGEVDALVVCTPRGRQVFTLRGADEALRVSLAEKDVLLKEIHHRVKNNMQVISSLLALQADRLVDAGMRAVLSDITGRVRSMALIHEKLYQSQDLAHVEFAEYAKSLLDSIWRGNDAANRGIRLILDLQPVWLPVNSAVPCGLILNELASNALKHAFAEHGAWSKEQRAASKEEASDGPAVGVTLRMDETGRVCLRVCDNGVGLPAGLDWRKADTLGLSLVEMLARQLNARVDASSEKGTEFAISFASSPRI